MKHNQWQIGMWWLLKIMLKSRFQTFWTMVYLKEPCPHSHIVKPHWFCGMNRAIECHNIMVIIPVFQWSVVWILTDRYFVVYCSPCSQMSRWYHKIAAFLIPRHCVLDCAGHECEWLSHFVKSLDLSNVNALEVSVELVENPSRWTADRKSTSECCEWWN